MECAKTPSKGTMPPPCDDATFKKKQGTAKEGPTTQSTDPMQLPENWHEKLQVGFGRPLTEEQFKALQASRGTNFHVIN